MASFADSAQVDFQFISDATTLNSSFDSITHMNGGTNAGLGIQFGYDNIVDGNARSGVRVAMVVITDGFSFDDVSTPSDAMRTHGIDMFSVGYNTANIVQLQEIANDPDTTFLYQGATISDLIGIVDQLVTEICGQPASFTG